MIGLKENETWDPYSATPPANPPKMFDHIKKPKSTTDNTYKVDSTHFNDKGLVMDSILGIRPTDIATVKYNRLAEWDKVLAHSMGILNMLDVFMASGNKAHDLYAAIKPYENSLPPEVKLLLVDQDRQVEDQSPELKLSRI